MNGSATLAELIHIGMPALLEQYGSKLTAHQRRALCCIEQCRTEALAATMMRCDDCGHLAERLRSCGHRCCPQCQHHSAVQWLDRQRAKLLPVEYFMITFTLPAALRPIAYRQPRAVYRVFFAAVAETLKSFGARHRELNADIGFTAVLHTHSRRLDYHPHIHVVIPAGGIARDGKMRLWRTLQGRYLFNGFALAKVFRAKCLEALRKAGVVLDVPPPRKWVAHCKHVGKGLPALQYLSRYLYRGVLSQSDILGFDPRRQTVTFRYRDGKSKRFLQRTSRIAGFLWQIAMQVLPKGLQRVRHYGFLHGNAKALRALVQLKLRTALPNSEPNIARPFLCPRCASPMSTAHVIAQPAPG